jgi:hypothetical protein
MKAGIFKCDNCKGEYRQSLRIGCLPPEWYALTKGDSDTELHFCCIECLITWTSCQTVNINKFKMPVTSHLSASEFKVTKEDCERWRDL